MVGMKQGLGRCTVHVIIVGGGVGVCVLSFHSGAVIS